jgi:hypothetical protein
VVHDAHPGRPQRDHQQDVDVAAGGDAAGRGKHHSAGKRNRRGVHERGDEHERIGVGDEPGAERLDTERLDEVVHDGTMCKHGTIRAG